MYVKNEQIFRNWQIKFLIQAQIRKGVFTNLTFGR